MDDLTIVESIRNGRSDQALKSLYRNFPAIRKLIRSRNGSTKDAEDIFQEALIILLRRAANPQFKLTAQLSTYLHGVCRLLWNEHLRNDIPAISFDTGLTIAEEAELNTCMQQEARVRLAEQVLGELKERCRELLLLFYERQLSLKDIAAKMGFGTENSAKNQKYKCLDAARTRLKELEQRHPLRY